ncbi:hypothetical protein QOT17_012740 [Balamuthia mandrillaris]
MHTGTTFTSTDGAPFATPSHPTTPKEMLQRALNAANNATALDSQQEFGLALPFYQAAVHYLSMMLQHEATFSSVQRETFAKKCEEYKARIYELLFQNIPSVPSSNPKTESTNAKDEQPTIINNNTDQSLMQRLNALKNKPEDITQQNLEQRLCQLLGREPFSVKSTKSKPIRTTTLTPTEEAKQLFSEVLESVTLEQREQTNHYEDLETSDTSTESFESDIETDNEFGSSY